MSDLILHNAKIATLDPAQPQAEALAIQDGVFTAVGDERTVMQLRSSQTQVLDARVPPPRRVPG